jgi:hypothetical protein
MGQVTDARIAEFREAVARGEASYKPATGRKLELLERMKTILDGGGPLSLSKVIDLEISGERDGNGYWSGACAPLEMIEELYSLCVEYWDLKRNHERAD